MFFVNILSGDVITKQLIILNEAESKHFNFTVVAVDCGNIPFMSNLSAPFTLPVLHVTAIDPGFPKKNSSVEYIITGGNA